MAKPNSSANRSCLTSKFSRFLKITLRMIFLIVWCLTPFSTLFQLHRDGLCTYPCVPGVLLLFTPHNILSKALAPFLHNHSRKMDIRRMLLRIVVEYKCSNPASRTVTKYADC